MNKSAIFKYGTAACPTISVTYTTVHSFAEQDYNYIESILTACQTSNNSSNKIRAIKIVRIITGLSLRQAKDIVDAIANDIINRVNMNVINDGYKAQISGIALSNNPYLSSEQNNYWGWRKGWLQAWKEAN